MKEKRKRCVTFYFQPSLIIRDLPIGFRLIGYRLRYFSKIE